MSRKKKKLLFENLVHMGSEALLRGDQAPDTQSGGAASQKDGQFWIFWQIKTHKSEYIRHKSNLILLHAPSSFSIIFPLPVFSFILLLLFLFSSIFLPSTNGGGHSSVGTVTTLLDGHSSVHGSGKKSLCFQKRPHWLWGPNSLHFTGYVLGALILGVKRSVREAEQTT
jgi:hypothetical protein